MAGFNLKNLVLTVAVECGPLDVLLVVGPVEGHGVIGVPNDELAAIVLAGEADDERSKLEIGPRSVDVGLEKA